jgi:secreted PhoX family phosphatase
MQVEITIAPKAMSISRREFLGRSCAVAIGFSGLRTFLNSPGAAHAAISPAAGYGELLPDPHKVLDLPRGFTYRVLSRFGERMDDGLIVPSKCDGMAAFAGPGGKTILVRNHELSPDDANRGPFGRSYELLDKVERSKLYDFGHGTMPGVGGTTTLLYDTTTGKVHRQHLSLAGTIRNCAGGPTPWGSWITCEETTMRAGEAGTNNDKDHGYNFEVPASAEGLVEAVPLKAMGRFRHEAIAVDPHSGVVYQTEDVNDGLIYRFIPAVPGKLAEGGRLQALAIVDLPGADTTNWDADAHAPATGSSVGTSPTTKAGDRVTRRRILTGVPMAVRWIDVDEIDSPLDDLRLRGHARRAARFARAEGMWYGRGAVYFVCTNGGASKLGQIFRYVPSPHEATSREQHRPGTLELFLESGVGNLIESADNLTVAPWGDLILAEDGGGDSIEAERLVGVTPQGQLYELARNVLNPEELAGVTFSPDGSTLFVNIYEPGTTIAINGPWRRQ